MYKVSIAERESSPKKYFFEIFFIQILKIEYIYFQLF